MREWTCLCFLERWFLALCNYFIFLLLPPYLTAIIDENTKTCEGKMNLSSSRSAEKALYKFFILLHCKVGIRDEESQSQRESQFANGTQLVSCKPQTFLVPRPLPIPWRPNLQIQPHPPTHSWSGFFFLIFWLKWCTKNTYAKRVSNGTTITEPYIQACLTSAN